eukprot:CFRG5666T1
MALLALRMGVALNGLMDVAAFVSSVSTVLPSNGLDALMGANVATSAPFTEDAKRYFGYFCLGLGVVRIFGARYFRDEGARVLLYSSYCLEVIVLASEVFIFKRQALSPVNGGCMVFCTILTLVLMNFGEQVKRKTLKVV